MMGADFAHPMLIRARQKSASVHSKTMAQLWPMQVRRSRRADAFRSRTASFDLVTTAFGFRNLANYEAGLTGNPARPETRRHPGDS